MAKLSTYINGLTEDTEPDTSNDMLIEYDDSATANKKLKLSTLIALASGTGVGADGWAAADAMTYASADDPTYTMTCAGDQTTKYYPGMRIKLTQTTVKYFVVTAASYDAPNTTITLYGGTDYDLANAAITSPYYSSAKAPAGFPSDRTKWVVKITDTTDRQKSSPSTNTIYYADMGSLNISVPIGCWELGFEVLNWTTMSTNVLTGQTSALSTANNSVSDNELAATTNAVGTVVANLVRREKIVTVASKTPYYLICKTGISSVLDINFRGDINTTTIWAECAYL